MKKTSSRKSNETLAKETHFTVDEVYALEVLFNNLSNSLHQDGLIHKDEFVLALFKTQGRGSNILIDKFFQRFDIKQNDVIDFEEFVHSLSIFHPQAGLEEKAKFAFSIMDLDNTNFIEREEVQRCLTVVLKEDPRINLDDEMLAYIIEKTFEEADLAGDGHISIEEWLTLVREQPSVISYMTLPSLKDITLLYSSFVWNKERPYT